MAISQGVLDSHPVLRLVPVPLRFNEIAVIGPYRQPLSPLAGVDEGDETAVRRALHERLVNLLGDFGLPTIGGRKVQNRALVPWGAIVFVPDRLELKPR